MSIDFARFDHCRILVIGDLMLDEYIWGHVDRISPEAPVQVVSVEREESTLGGAGNVVNNLVTLGASVSVAGVVGDDARGEQLQATFHHLGVDTAGVIREASRLTTRKTRVIAVSQHVVRIDRETTRAVSLATYQILLEAVTPRVAAVDAILISDYGKGVVTADLVATLVALAKHHGKPVIVDPKGLDFTKYRDVTLLKPNRKEAGLAARVEINGQADLMQAMTRLQQETQAEALLVTCGADGMVLLEQHHRPYHIQAQSRQVFDVSGAGDTVLAVMGLAMAAGAGLNEGAELANTAAGIVVGKVGTATVTRQELTDSLRACNAPNPEVQE